MGIFLNTIENGDTSFNMQILKFDLIVYERFDKFITMTFEGTLNDDMDELSGNYFIDDELYGTWKARKI
jgi:hypothetical protein